MSDRELGETTSSLHERPSGTGRSWRPPRWLGLVLGYGVSAGLLAMVLSQFHGWDLLQAVDLPILVAAGVLSLVVNVGLASLKLWLLLQYARFRIAFGRILSLILALLPVTLFLPFQSGHLLYPLALAQEKELSGLESVEAVAFDKWTSFVGTVLLIGVGQFLLPADHLLKLPWVLWVAAAVVLFYFHAPRLVTRILKLLRLDARVPHLARRIPASRKVRLLFLAALYQSSDTVTMLLACHALHVPEENTVILGAYPIVLLLSYAPVSVSGIGVRELLAIYVFSNDLSNAQAVSATLLVDVIEYLVPGAAGVVVLPQFLQRVGGRLKPKAHGKIVDNVSGDR